MVMRQNGKNGWRQCLIGGPLIGKLTRESMFFLLMPVIYVLHITRFVHSDFLKVRIDQENCFYYSDNMSVCSEVFETFREYIQHWSHYYSECLLLS